MGVSPRDCAERSPAAGASSARRTALRVPRRTACMQYKERAAARDWGLADWATRELWMATSACRPRVPESVSLVPCPLSPCPLSRPSHLDHIHQFLHRARRLPERGVLVRRQLDLEDLFEAARPELAWHADELIADAVLALQIHRARQDLLLV